MFGKRFGKGEKKCVAKKKTAIRVDGVKRGV